MIEFYKKSQALDHPNAMTKGMQTRPENPAWYNRMALSAGVNLLASLTSTSV
jgi:hypothetical protein